VIDPLEKRATQASTDPTTRLEDLLRQLMAHGAAAARRRRRLYGCALCVPQARRIAGYRSAALSSCLWWPCSERVRRSDRRQGHDGARGCLCLRQRSGGDTCRSPRWVGILEPERKREAGPVPDRSEGLDVGGADDLRSLGRVGGRSQAPRSAAEGHRDRGGGQDRGSLDPVRQREAGPAEEETRGIRYQVRQRGDRRSCKARAINRPTSSVGPCPGR